MPEKTRRPARPVAPRDRRTVPAQPPHGRYGERAQHGTFRPGPKRPAGRHGPPETAGPRAADSRVAENLVGAILIGAALGDRPAQGPIAVAVAKQEPLAEPPLPYAAGSQADGQAGDKDQQQRLDLRRMHRFQLARCSCWSRQARWVEWGGTSGGASQRAWPVGQTTPIACASFRVRVVDENSRPVPTGVTGECQIRRRGLVPHYWKDEGDSQGLLTSDGWLRTGQLATRNRLGLIRLVGAMKDVIKSGGYSVYLRRKPSSRCVRANRFASADSKSALPIRKASPRGRPFRVLV